VTEGIVDDLEAIEIEEEHGQARAFALRVRQRHGEAVLEQQAVRQIRQRVVIGEMLDLLLGVRALGDVADDAHHAAAAIAVSEISCGKFTPSRRSPVASPRQRPRCSRAARCW
jgi:hypothetical protein